MVGNLTPLQYDDEFFGLWQTINNTRCSGVDKKQCTDTQKADGKS